MSYDIKLKDKNGRVYKSFSTHEGGTMPQEGYKTTEYNLTYNYGPLYRKYFHTEGLPWIDGKTAKETQDRLYKAIKKLGTVQDVDYWKAAKGNAGAALLPLLLDSMIYPEGIWSVN